MAGLRAAYPAAAGLALIAAGCTWQRFDDLSSNAPVVLLDRPGALSAGFGYGIATLTGDDGTTELVSAGAPGHQGAAVYALGSGDQPAIDPLGAAQCTGEPDTCFLASSLAGIKRVTQASATPARCFVDGIGSQGAGRNGLLGGCDDNIELWLPVPDEVKKQLVDPAIVKGVPDVVVLASDRAQAPALVAGGPSKRFAWFYGPTADTAIPLVPPGATAEAGFGSAVASLRIGASSRIFAVSAPDRGHVYLFRTDDFLTAYSVGCLGGPSGFGRTLASGPIDTDADDELVVADDSEVMVIDGKALASLPPTTSTTCSLASLPAGALVASFGCGQTSSISGCAGSNFGASIAVGDLDGDNDGEVIVGAPDMTTRGVDHAGAVLVYDVEGDDKSRLSDVKFISSAEDGDRLGAFVAAARTGTHDIIAAGAPGGGKTALFYCTGLAAADKQGGRCQ